MKTFSKILTILAVAALLAGVFYGAVTTFSSGGVTQPSLNERPANMELDRAERPDSTGGLQLPIDSIKNLLIISMIAWGYVNFSKWIKRFAAIPVQPR